MPVDVMRRRGLRLERRRRRAHILPWQRLLLLLLLLLVMILRLLMLLSVGRIGWDQDLGIEHRLAILRVWRIGADIVLRRLRMRLMVLGLLQVLRRILTVVRRWITHRLSTSTGIAGILSSAMNRKC